MNNKLLLFALAVVTFSSCTTLYKSGQTPDDVYYSPVRQYGGEVKKEQRQQEDYRNNDYVDFNEYRQIRMGFSDPRWRYLDNDISYSPYLYGYNYGYYYNPYYYPAPVYNPVIITNPNPKVTTPRVVNLGSYGNGYVNTNTTINPKTGLPITTPVVRPYNGSRLGNAIRSVVTPQGNRYNNQNTTPYNNNNNNTQTNRSYTPSTPAPSSSTPAASSGAISRPARVKN